MSETECSAPRSALISLMQDRDSSPVPTMRGWSAAGSGAAPADGIQRWQSAGWRKSMDNRCVCCGEIIPEGRQVCPACEEKPAKKVSNEFCLDCIYFQGEFEINRCCMYYLTTDKRRPCPPGDGCTVKVKRSHRLKTYLDYYKYKKKGDPKC